MKLKSKDSGKFLGINNGNISLQTLGNKLIEYELIIVKKDLKSNYFFLVSLKELKKSKKVNPLCITPLTLNDGSPLILKEIDSSNENQLWKFENGYFINKELKDGKKMCIDVCCEKKDDGAIIIIYHIKNPNKANNIDNQLWEII